MFSLVLKLFVLLLMHTLVSCEKFEELIKPLKKQVFEQVEFPNTIWESLTIEEEKEYKEIYDNIILEKQVEYNIIIREFEESLANYKVEQGELDTILRSLSNSIDKLGGLNKENQIQEILGGKGIVEFSKLNRNLEFGKDLLEKELLINKNSIENSGNEIFTNLRQPVDNLVQKVTNISSNTEKYLKALQLLNVYRERSHEIYNLEQLISKNTVSIGLLVSGWTYILSEIETLIKDQLQPLIDVKNEKLTSGHDMLKKLELINSIIDSTILIKYGKLENEKIDEKGGNESLIKEIKIKNLDMEKISITDQLIKWRLELIPSILNIFQSPLSKLLIEINKYMMDANLLDGFDQINERIQETNEAHNELNQIKSKIDSIWFSLKYLSKDDVLVKKNEKIKSVTDYDDVYDENNQKISLLFNHLIEEKNQIESLSRNSTFSENHQIFLALNTLKCLSEYYQISKENDLNVLFTYSKINQECVGFFLNKINSYNIEENKEFISIGQIKDPATRFENIIFHYISIIFPNSEEKDENSFNNYPISELMQELELSYSHIDVNETESFDLRKNNRLNNINEKMVKYNDYIFDFKKNLEGIKKTTSLESFEILRHYLSDLTKIFEDHVKESIGNKDDASILFDQLLKEFTVMLEELSEKELNNDHLKVSISKRFEDIQFLFNDFIARINLEFQRSNRLNSKEFVDNTQTSLEEIDVEIRIFNEELAQVNEFMYKKHLNNILSLSTYVYTSKLLLNPVTNLKDENKLTGEYFPDQFTDLFREKYRYILNYLGYYYKIYQDFKEKKKIILDRENQINNKLSNIESELMKRSNITTINSSIMHKIQRQRKIAEKILAGYLMLTITLYHSRSEDIKNTITALNHSISNFDHQISVFQKQNKLDGKIGFKSVIKNILRSRKYLKLRKYYKRMKKFQSYLSHKKQQISEFLKFSESTLNSLNQELIKIVDQYLCRKKGVENDLEYFYNERNDNNENIEPIQIIMGDLYNIFSRIGRLEYYHSPKYLMSNSKLLGEVLKQYRQISHEINLYQKKSQKIFITQEKTLNNAYKLIRIAIPASYMISKYNKFPKEYQRFTFKTGKLDIIGDEPKHINIRGWDLKKGKKSLALENELIIERKYIKNDQEFYEIKKQVEKQLKEYSLLPDQKIKDKIDTKTLIFFIPDDLVDQMIFEIERNQIALRQGYNSKLDKASIQTLMNNYVHELLKRRKSLYSQLSSKPFITKQAQCSIKDDKEMENIISSIEEKKEREKSNSIL
ncbi:hypothetical protein [Cryptosporidium parvum Iowa II]|uniref:Uncharacterized protein n=1 Tax=Cryptosporidium parvum (strain Iowa II) TaxID=353152 RepID=Q5CRD7_CRYPI|nr:hypothetical protein [Cryptosporidium parvum Iowa II]EAK88022.1 large hypothetical protein with signal peptide [Cryptosporidium parvum Iowa II]